MKIYRVYFIYLGGGVCRFLLTMDITGKCTKHLKIEHYDHYVSIGTREFISAYGLNGPVAHFL